MSQGHKNVACGLAAILIVSLFTLASLCITTVSGADSVLPADRCVFIDHHVHMDGVLLEGKGIGLMIDFPTYGFDKEQRKLTGMINFDINDSLVAIYGDGQSLAGAMGGGAATMLYGAYALPYESRGLAIMSVQESGAVTIQYANETIVLQPGEEWSRITSKIITTNSYDGNSTRINATTTDRIVNYGLLNKKDVVKN